MADTKYINISLGEGFKLLYKGYSQDIKITKAEENTYSIVINDIIISGIRKKGVENCQLNFSSSYVNNIKELNENNNTVNFRVYTLDVVDEKCDKLTLTVYYTVYNIDGEVIYVSHEEVVRTEVDIQNVSNVDGIKLPSYYRPFTFNAVVLLLPQGAFNLDKLEYNNKATNTTNNDGLLFYSIANGITLRDEIVTENGSIKTIYRLGDINFNYNINKYSLDIKNVGRSFSEIRNDISKYKKVYGVKQPFDKNYVAEKFPTWNNKKEIQIIPGLKLVDDTKDMVISYRDSTYQNRYYDKDSIEPCVDLSGKKMHNFDTSGFLNFGFTVRDAAPDDSSYNGDYEEQSVFYNGVKFYDSITNEDGVLKFEGMSSTGVRYYALDAAAYRHFSTSLLSIDTDADETKNYYGINCQDIFRQGDRQMGWQSILTFTDWDNDSAYFYLYDHWRDKVNNEANGAEYVIGVYDEYTMLDGASDLGSETDYKKEINNPTSMVLRHAPKMSIVKVYKL